MEENLSEDGSFILVDEIRYKLWDIKARSYTGKEEIHKDEMQARAQKLAGDNWPDFYRVDMVRWLVYRVQENTPTTLVACNTTVTTSEVVQLNSHQLDRLITARAKHAVNSIWNLIERKFPKKKRPKP